MAKKKKNKQNPSLHQPVKSVQSKPKVSPGNLKEKGVAKAKKTKFFSSPRPPLISRIMEVGIILVVLGTPLVFSIWSKNNFLLPKEAYAQSILIVLLGIYLIKTVDDKKFHLVKSDLWYPLLAFAAVTTISIVNTVSLYLSLLDFANFVTYFFILFLTINFIRTHTQKNRIFWTLVAVCFISSIYGVFQFYDFDFKFWARQGGRGNIFSTFGNPNRYSGFVAAVIPAMVGYFLTVKGTIKKYILAFVIPLTYTGVMMTFTRGAQLGLAVALFFMLIIALSFFKLSFFKTFYKGIIYLLCVFLVITAIFSTENPINISRHTVAERAVSAVEGEEVSVVQRLMMWEISLLMTKDQPVIGHGIGTFKYHYLWYQGKYFDNPVNEDKLYLAVWAREAHNEYVQILVELGILGFIFWLWLLFAFFRGRYKQCKEERDNPHLLLARLGFSMGALVILVNATVDFPLHLIPNGILLFLLMGLATVVQKDSPM
ncbi:O-antigen ligase family protein [Candidatus Aerophobetes bacterium]|nr:O-antigen ligase family protein [Candidatus Aerophobetes bacterium]